jgi:DnaK suppressor protein
LRPAAGGDGATGNEGGRTLMTTKSGKGRPSKKAKPTKAAARKAPAKPKAPAKAAKKPAPQAPRSLPKAPAPKGATPKAAARPAPPPARPTKAARRARSKELDHYRALLVERRRELLEAYNTSKGDRRVHPDSGTEDYIDYAVSSYAKEFLLSLSEMDRKQILLVKEALDRIARTEYGNCQQCSQEISRKRLEVAPWARYCIRCQDLEEQGLLPQYPARMDGDALDEEEAEEPPAPDLDEEIEAEEVPDLEEEPLGGADEDPGDAEEE